MPQMGTGAQEASGQYAKYGLEYDPFNYGTWTRDGNFKLGASHKMYNFTPKQFQKLRNHSGKDSALRQLKEIGCDVATTPLKLYTHPIPRVCFMCVNTYTSSEKALGVGPLNDSITVGANHRTMGYFVYYLHNPKPVVFMNYLKMFLKMTSECLTVYYTGHGSQVRDTSGDEADGYDEVMVFENGYVLDDDLAVALKENHNPTCRVLLLNDCCRSGTIWDIPEDMRKAEREFPENILSISASTDRQTSKQVSGLGKIRSMQGLFTFHFFQLIRENPDVTPDAIVPILNKELRRFQQNVTMLPTRRTMMKEPIFSSHK